MPVMEVHDMDTTDEYFVGTCTHENESDETDIACEHRLTWFSKMRDNGMRVKVATLYGNRVGFLYMMPIEVSPWGPLGNDLMVIPCLFVSPKHQKKGVGQALIAAAEKETTRQGRKALVTAAYFHDFWFMPASFFLKHGFTVVDRKEQTTILWKVFDKSAEVPRFLERNYQFKPVAGKVVIDLFWHTFCLTCIVEVARVREVVKEFGEGVVLNEYCADDRDIFTDYQIPRAIFINGKEIGWGYEAPRDGIRKAISEAIAGL